MVLSTQQFASVINFLRANAGVSRGSEKRRATRMGLECKIKIAPVTDGRTGAPVTVLTRDLSMEGMGIMTAVALKQGQQFVALLPVSDSETLCVLTEVLHSFVVADGIYSLGCRFGQVLSKHATQQIHEGNPADAARVRDSILK